MLKAVDPKIIKEAEDSSYDLFHTVKLPTFHTLEGASVAVVDEEDILSLFDKLRTRLRSLEKAIIAAPNLSEPDQERFKQVIGVVMIGRYHLDDIVFHAQSNPKERYSLSRHFDLRDPESYHLVMDAIDFLIENKIIKEIKNSGDCYKVTPHGLEVHKMLVECLGEYEYSED